MQVFLEKDVGYLSIILGPMFSGKTTKLINIYNDYRRKDIKPLVINYIHDNFNNIQNNRMIKKIYNYYFHPSGVHYLVL